MISAALALAAVQVQAPAQPLSIARLDGEAVRVHVLHEGQLRTLELTPSSVRTPDYKIFASGPEGTREFEPGPVATYRGSLLEEPGASIGAFLIDGRLTAVVDYPDLRPDWIVQPTEGTSADGRVLHTIARPSDLSDDLEPFCGVDSHGHSESILPQTAASSGTIPVAKVALDADVETFYDNGSNISATATYMEGMLLLASMVYEKEVDLLLVSPFTNVWYNDNHPLYPYDQPQCMPSGSSQYYDFNSCMAPFWSQSWLPDFDVVQGLLGSATIGNFINGLANFNAICGFQTSTTFRSWGMNRSRPEDVAKTLNILVHELGHNFNLFHVSDGIMQSSPSLEFFFQASQIPQLQTRITGLQNTGCIDGFGTPTAPPTIASISPSVAQVYGAGPITITGTNLDTVIELLIDGDYYGYGELTPISSTELQFELKHAPAASLGVKTLEVLGGGGSAATTIELVATSPIQQQIVEIDFNPQYYVNTQAFASPGDVIGTGWSFDSTLIDFGTWNILNGWTALGIETCDAIGYASIISYTADPSMIGVTYYVQSIGTNSSGARQSTVPDSLCHGC